MTTDDALFQFFGAWFHQDWPDDHQDWRDIVADCMAVNSPAEIKAILDGVKQIFDSHLGEQELEKKLVTYGSYFYPPGLGLTYEEWLRQLVQAIENTRKLPKP